MRHNVVEPGNNLKRIGRLRRAAIDDCVASIIICDSATDLNRAVPVAGGTATDGQVPGAGDLAADSSNTTDRRVAHERHHAADDASGVVDAKCAEAIVL